MFFIILYFKHIAPRHAVGYIILFTYLFIYSHQGVYDKGLLYLQHVGEVFLLAYSFLDFHHWVWEIKKNNKKNEKDAIRNDKERQKER